MEPGIYCVLLWMKDCKVQKLVLVTPNFTSISRTVDEAGQHTVEQVNNLPFQDGMNWIQLPCQIDVTWLLKCRATLNWEVAWWFISFCLTAGFQFCSLPPEFSAIGMKNLYWKLGEINLALERWGASSEGGYITRSIRSSWRKQKKDKVGEMKTEMIG